jgi:hypothetical protein
LRKQAIASGTIDAPAVAEPGHCCRHDRGARAGERDEAQPPAAQPGHRLELGLGIGQAREDRVGVTDEHATRVGQVHAAGGAIHELRAGLALQRCDLLRDRRLGVGQRLGGGGERTLRRDLFQNP